jgi:prepilin-type N-terminal cleavage/methylation domain-containing protein
VIEKKEVGMKRGFTLLELMVVIIILGVLATLGVMQYQAAIEKSRGAEARQILGQLRSQCAAIYMAEGSVDNCDEGNLRVGADNDMIPDACRATHYFSYAVTTNTGDNLIVEATRCAAGDGGKAPDADSANTLELDIDYAAGTDTWSSTGGY